MYKGNMDKTNTRSEAVNSWLEHVAYLKDSNNESYIRKIANIFVAGKQMSRDHPYHPEVYI